MAWFSDWISRYLRCPWCGGRIRRRYGWVDMEELRCDCGHGIGYEGGRLVRVYVPFSKGGYRIPVGCLLVVRVMEEGSGVWERV